MTKTVFMFYLLSVIFVTFSFPDYEVISLLLSVCVCQFERKRLPRLFTDKLGGWFQGGLSQIVPGNFHCADQLVCVIHQSCNLPFTCNQSVFSCSSTYTRCQIILSMHDSPAFSLSLHTWNWSSLSADPRESNPLPVPDHGCLQSGFLLSLWFITTFFVFVHCCAASYHWFPVFPLLFPGLSRLPLFLAGQVCKQKHAHYLFDFKCIFCLII